MTDHRLRLFALWGTIALTLTACSSDETHLPALLADPMASYEAEGIALIDTFEQAERPGFLGGKSTHAQVTRTYRIVDQSKAERVLTEAVAFANAAGWRLGQALTSSTGGYSGTRGTKELAPGSGRLSISVGPDPVRNNEARWILSIHLDFGTVRLDGTTTTAPGGG